MSGGDDEPAAEVATAAPRRRRGGKAATSAELAVADDDTAEGPLHVEVISVAGDPLASLRLPSDTTVGGLKRRIASLRGVPPPAQRLIASGQAATAAAAAAAAASAALADGATVEGAASADAGGSGVASGGGGGGGDSPLDDTTPLANLGDSLVVLTLVVLSYSAEMSAALLNAAEEGDLRAAALAIRAWADPNIFDTDGWAPLHMASLNGHSGIVRLLLEACADKNRTAQDADAAAPLHIAAWSGCVEAVRLLCDRRADVNGTQGSQWTALHVASRNGDMEVVRLLCCAGADRQLRGAFGGKAVHVAILHGHFAVAQLLLLPGDGGGGSPDEPERALPRWRLGFLLLIAREAHKVAWHLAWQLLCRRRQQWVARGQ